MKILLGDYQERLIKHDLRGCLGVSEIWVEQDNVFIKCYSGDVWQFWFEYDGNPTMMKVSS